MFATSAIPEGELIREYNLVREVTVEAPVNVANGEALEHCTYPLGEHLKSGHT